MKINAYVVHVHDPLPRFDLAFYLTETFLESWKEILYVNDKHKSWYLNRLAKERDRALHFVIKWSTLRPKPNTQLCLLNFVLFGVTCLFVLQFSRSTSALAVISPCRLPDMSVSSYHQQIYFISTGRHLAATVDTTPSMLLRNLAPAPASFLSVYKYCSVSVVTLLQICFLFSSSYSKT